DPSEHRARTPGASRGGLGSHDREETSGRGGGPWRKEASGAGDPASGYAPNALDAANSAWQQLSVLAHDLIRSFQLETLAEPNPRSRRRTCGYLFRSMRTLRFLLIAPAGRLTRLGASPRTRDGAAV